MVMTREQINELRERQEKSGPTIATEFGPLLPPGRHSKAAVDRKISEQQDFHIW